MSVLLKDVPSDRFVKREVNGNDKSRELVVVRLVRYAHRIEIQKKKRVGVAAI
jgi:hypothetical protein